MRSTFISNNIHSDYYANRSMGPANVTINYLNYISPCVL